MKILVTAGNTQVPIDRVRCITNVFTGRTGSAVSYAAAKRDHEVVLLTSAQPEIVDQISTTTVQRYQTYDQLRDLLEKQLNEGDYDALIHSAAVSDYLVESVHHGQDQHSPQEALSGKIKSYHEELWIRLTPAPKLVDMVRNHWGFTGILVKFKLEVGVTKEALLETAERSRQQSNADLMVANTLEAKNEWAFLGPTQRGYEKIGRNDLPRRLIESVEELHQQRKGI